MVAGAQYVQVCKGSTQNNSQVLKKVNGLYVGWITPYGAKMRDQYGVHFFTELQSERSSYYSILILCHVACKWLKDASYIKFIHL